MSSSDSKQNRFVNTNANVRLKSPNTWGAEPTRDRPVGQRYGSVLRLSVPKRKPLTTGPGQSLPRPVTLPSQRKDRFADASPLVGKASREDGAPNGQVEGHGSSLSSHSRLGSSSNTWNQVKAHAQDPVATDKYGFPVTVVKPQYDYSAREFPTLDASAKQPSLAKIQQRDQVDKDDAYFTFDDRDVVSNQPAPPAERHPEHLFGRSWGDGDHRDVPRAPDTRDAFGRGIEGSRAFRSEYVPAGRNADRGAAFRYTPPGHSQGLGRSDFGAVDVECDTAPHDDYMGPMTRVAEVPAAIVISSSLLAGRADGGERNSGTAAIADDVVASEAGQEEDEEGRAAYLKELEAIQREAEEEAERAAAAAAAAVAAEEEHAADSAAAAAAAAASGGADEIAEGTWEDEATDGPHDDVAKRVSGGEGAQSGLKPVDPEFWRKRQAELEEEEAERRARAAAKLRALEEALQQQQQEEEEEQHRQQRRQEQLQHQHQRQQASEDGGSIDSECTSERGDASLPLSRGYGAPPPRPCRPRPPPTEALLRSGAGYDVRPDDRRMANASRPVASAQPPTAKQPPPPPPHAQPTVPAWTQPLFKDSAAAQRPTAGTLVSPPASVPPPPGPALTASVGISNEVHDPQTAPRRGRGEEGSHGGRMRGRGAAGTRNARRSGDSESADAGGNGSRGASGRGSDRRRGRGARDGPSISRPSVVEPLRGPPTQAAPTAAKGVPDPTAAAVAAAAAAAAEALKGISLPPPRRSSQGGHASSGASERHRAGRSGAMQREALSAPSVASAPGAPSHGGKLEQIPSPTAAAGQGPRMFDYADVGASGYALPADGSRGMRLERPAADDYECNDNTGENLLPSNILGMDDDYDATPLPQPPSSNTLCSGSLHHSHGAVSPEAPYVPPLPSSHGVCHSHGVEASHGFGSSGQHPNATSSNNVFGAPLGVGAPQGFTADQAARASPATLWANPTDWNSQNLRGLGGQHGQHMSGGGSAVSDSAPQQGVGSGSATAAVAASGGYGMQPPPPPPPPPQQHGDGSGSNGFGSSFTYGGGGGVFPYATASPVARRPSFQDAPLVPTSKAPDWSNHFPANVDWGHGMASGRGGSGQQVPPQQQPQQQRQPPPMPPQLPRGVAGYPPGVSGPGGVPPMPRPPPSEPVPLPRDARKVNMDDVEKKLPDNLGLGTSPPVIRHSLQRGGPGTGAGGSSGADAAPFVPGAARGGKGGSARSARGEHGLHGARGHQVHNGAAGSGHGQYGGSSGGRGRNHSHGEGAADGDGGLSSRRGRGRGGRGSGGGHHGTARRAKRNPGDLPATAARPVAVGE